MKVRLTEKELKKVIKESISSILNEGSDILYHFTDLSGLMGIVENDEFELTDNRMEMEGGYVMSLSRTKFGGYGNVMLEMGANYMLVRLTIDGRKLNQKYKTYPINDLYMYPDEILYTNQKDKELYKFGEFHHPKNKPSETLEPDFEYEDRVISKSPVIPNASTYITRVDILGLDINTDDEEMAKFLYIFLRDYAGRIHYYNDKGAFFSQNRAKELPMTEFYKDYWYPLFFLVKKMGIKTMPDANGIMAGIRQGKAIAKRCGWKGI